MFAIRDAVAVVTGASSGLGRRIALDLARRGGVVTAVARREDRLRAVADGMRRTSPASRYAVCDVSDTDRYLSVLREVEQRHGHIDLLINNAGIGEPPDEGLAKYRIVMDTNYFAAVAGTLEV